MYTEINGILKALASSDPQPPSLSFHQLAFKMIRAIYNFSLYHDLIDFLFPFSFFFGFHFNMRLFFGNVLRGRPKYVLHKNIIGVRKREGQERDS